MLLLLDKVDHMRVSGSSIQKASQASVPSVQSVQPQYTYSNLGINMGSTLNKLQTGQRLRASIANGERPSNVWYRVTERSAFWHMYRYMDWLFSEVSVLSTLRLRTESELFRYDLGLTPKFMRKCEDCGYESQVMERECPVCKSIRMRPADASQKKYLEKPNGKTFIEDANYNHQALIDVFKSYAESEIQNNQAYLLCVTGEAINDADASLIYAKPLEFLAIDPKYVRYLYDDTGKPGTKYAFTRDDRSVMVNLDENPEALNDYDRDGKLLEPAYWQIGNNFGGTGEYKLYNEDEVYQDKWYRQSLVYGTPIWYDIEDDALAYHYIEKHNLTKYKFGYVRKIVIIPGLSDDDIDDMTKGIQDVLAQNDNSIPIVCLPPQIPGTPEIRAQTLELGTESASDLIMVKNDIRDRMCAHGGMPNLFAGDVEASGGMNNESQQITVFDRYLMGIYNNIDRMCAWFMSWFPMITDWELTVLRPSKAYTDAKRRMDKIDEAKGMLELGYEVYTEFGEFRYSKDPAAQELQHLQIQLQIEQTKMQISQAKMQNAGGAPPMPPEGAQGSGEDLGDMSTDDGEGPAEKGTMRREDAEVGASKDEVDVSKNESDDALEM